MAIVCRLYAIRSGILIQDTTWSANWTTTTDFGQYDTHTTCTMQMNPHVGLNALLWIIICDTFEPHCDGSTPLIEAQFRGSEPNLWRTAASLNFNPFSLLNLYHFRIKSFNGPQPDRTRTVLAGKVTKSGLPNYWLGMNRLNFKFYLLTGSH